MNKKQLAVSLVLNLAALLFLLLSFSRPAATETVELNKEPAASAVRESLPRRETARNYSDIVNRDLFHPLRGKVPEETATAETRPNAKSNLRFDLKGVFHSGGRRGALISAGGAPGRGQAPTDLKKADAEVVFEGGSLGNGYVLESVGNDHVIVARGAEKNRIELEKLIPPELPPAPAGGPDRPPVAPEQSPVGTSRVATGTPGGPAPSSEAPLPGSPPTGGPPSGTPVITVARPNAQPATPPAAPPLSSPPPAAAAPQPEESR